MSQIGITEYLTTLPPNTTEFTIKKYYTDFIVKENPVDFEIGNEVFDHVVSQKAFDFVLNLCGCTLQNEFFDVFCSSFLVFDNSFCFYDASGFVVRALKNIHENICIKTQEHEREKKERENQKRDSFKCRKEICGCDESREQICGCEEIGCLERGCEVDREEVCSFKERECEMIEKETNCGESNEQIRGCFKGSEDVCGCDEFREQVCGCAVNGEQKCGVLNNKKKHCYFKKSKLNSLINNRNHQMESLIRKQPYEDFIDRFYNLNDSFTDSQEVIFSQKDTHRFEEVRKAFQSKTTCLKRIIAVCPDNSTRNDEADSLVTFHPQSSISQNIIEINPINKSQNISDSINSTTRTSKEELEVIKNSKDEEKQQDIIITKNTAINLEFIEEINAFLFQIGEKIKKHFSENHTNSIYEIEDILNNGKNDQNFKLSILNDIRKLEALLNNLRLRNEENILICSVSNLKKIEKVFLHSVLRLNPFLSAKTVEGSVLIYFSAANTNFRACLMKINKTTAEAVKSLEMYIKKIQNYESTFLKQITQRYGPFVVDTLESSNKHKNAEDVIKKDDKCVLDQLSVLNKNMTGLKSQFNQENHQSNVKVNSNKIIEDEKVCDLTQEASCKKENSEKRSNEKYIKISSVYEPRISYFGNKDKRAVTFQQICIQDANFLNILKLSILTDNKLKIFDIKQSRESAKLGNIKGNSFEIKIRVKDCQTCNGQNSINLIKNDKHNKYKNEENYTPFNLHSHIPLSDLVQINQPEMYFINYFGNQRFGTNKDTHLIGHLLIKKDYEKAVKFIMKIRKNESESIRKGKYLYKLGKYEQSLHYLRNLERKIVIYTRDSRSFKNMFTSLRREDLKLYYHAVQSYLFNMQVSEIIRRCKIAIKDTVKDFDIDKIIDETTCVKNLFDLLDTQINDILDEEVLEISDEKESVDKAYEEAENVENSNEEIGNKRVDEMIVDIVNEKEIESNKSTFFRNKLIKSEIFLNKHFVKFTNGQTDDKEDSINTISEKNKDTITNIKQEIIDNKAFDSLETHDSLNLNVTAKLIQILKSKQLNLAILNSKHTKGGKRNIIETMKNISFNIFNDHLFISFSLNPSVYATMAIREILRTNVNLEHF